MSSVNQATLNSYIYSLSVSFYKANFISYKELESIYFEKNAIK